MAEETLRALKSVVVSLDRTTTDLIDGGWYMEACNAR
jgi:hypothetical protein